jgi:adenylyltransferase/sulfurtransferase
VILDKPMVHGAIYKHEGQVSVFNYNGGPTYRCYNPSEVTGDFRNPQSADVGLLGVLPGIAGTIMANEVIKIITGTGIVLSGKVLMFDIYDYTFNIMEVINIPENHNITKMNDNY